MSSSCVAKLEVVCCLRVGGVRLAQRAERERDGGCGVRGLGLMSILESYVLCDMRLACTLFYPIILVDSGVIPPLRACIRFSTPIALLSGRAFHSTLPSRHHSGWG